MARNPYHLPPDVIDLMGTALRTAELFKLDSTTERLLRESAMLSDQHVKALKALEQLTKPLDLPASFRWDYSAQFAHIQTALDGLAGFADIAKMNSLTKTLAAQDRLLEQTRFIQDSIDRSCAMFGATAESLARLATFDLGAGLGMEHYRHGLDSGMKSLADSAASIYAVDQQTLVSLPRLAIERPPQELFIHVAGVEAITSTTDEGQVQAEALDDDSESLLPLLESLGPEFLQKWAGARQALASRNPDRIAHASVSLRELFRMVLHHVAPDDQIQAWSQSKDDFENGRPTRAARFRFATRSIAHPPFAGFLAKDSSAALELVTLFNRGLHESSQSVTERQVHLMTLRMEQVLRFLLEVARASDS